MNKIYDQKRKRDFIERKLSSIDESRDELRTNRGNEDFRGGTKRRRETGGWSTDVFVVDCELLVRRIAEIERFGLVIRGNDVAVVDLDMGIGCSARYCWVWSVVKRV